MGKYTRYSSRPEMKPRPWEIHPIWRGIGCLLLVIGPIIAFAAAHFLVNLNLERGWLPIPPELVQTVVLPGLNYPATHFYSDVLAGVALLLIGFALIMVVYSLIYAILGPSRYGPLDSPPIRRPPKGRS